MSRPMSNNAIGCAFLLFLAAMPLLLAVSASRNLLLLAKARVRRLVGGGKS